jgi:hypothetical protein
MAMANKIPDEPSVIETERLLEIVPGEAGSPPKNINLLKSDSNSRIGGINLK